VKDIVHKSGDFKQYSILNWRSQADTYPDYIKLPICVNCLPATLLKTVSLSGSAQNTYAKKTKKCALCNDNNIIMALIL